MTKISIFHLISVILVVLIIIFANDIRVYATSMDKIVVVSLGDSYSSGEGIEPFYGQEKIVAEKVKDKNWLAHRSRKSWGSMLEIPGVEGTLSQYFSEECDGTENCKWYFKAASGAETKHIIDEEQEKPWSREKITESGAATGIIESGCENLPIQMDVFDEIEAQGESVDYVTLTIGGNDMQFSDIIATTVTGIIGTDTLKARMYDIWINYDKQIKSKIKEVYENINARVGNQALIIVAGYPRLLSKSGGCISKAEAKLINDSASKFNSEIKKMVEECAASGMNIVFVDVEAEFNGHEAYTSDAWINPIYPGVRLQDLQANAVSSQYSIHPNEKGAQAYARCVNATIENLASNTSSVSGKICKAMDTTGIIADATINIYREQDMEDKSLIYRTITSGADGRFDVTLSEGIYMFEIIKDGYIDCCVYVTVSAGETEYLETVPMVESGSLQEGIATGEIIDVTAGLIIDSTVTYRKGWNNTEYGDVIYRNKLSSEYTYEVSLPSGYYTVCVECPTYITDFVNIVVMSGQTTTKNVMLSPNSFDGYRIVLVMGTDDLDSHLVENIGGDRQLHVYYGNRFGMRPLVDICLLNIGKERDWETESISLSILNTSLANPTHYYYYVHLYSGDNKLSDINAQVKVYKGDVLMRTFDIPTVGSGKYWHVFDIVNGLLVPKNKIELLPVIDFDTPEKKDILLMTTMEEVILAMQSETVLATDSEAIIATDSEARLATGSEAIVDVDNETMHDKYDAIKENIGDEDGEKDSVVAEDSDDVLSDGEAVMDIEMNESVSTDEGMASELSEEKLQDEKSDMDVADVVEEDVEVETRSNTDKTDAVNDVQVYTATPSNVA